MQLQRVLQRCAACRVVEHAPAVGRRRRGAKGFGDRFDILRGIPRPVLSWRTMQPEVHDPVPATRHLSAWGRRRIGGNPANPVTDKQRVGSGREPRLMPRLAHQSAVVAFTNEIEEARRDAVVEPQRRRQLDEHRAAFRSEAGAFLEASFERQPRPFQLLVVRDYPRQLDRKAEARRSRCRPSGVGRCRVRTMEGRIDFCAAEQARITLKMRACAVKVMRRCARDAPACGANIETPARHASSIAGAHGRRWAAHVARCHTSTLQVYTGPLKSGSVGALKPVRPRCGIRRRVRSPAAR